MPGSRRNFSNNLIEAIKILFQTQLQRTSKIDNFIKTDDIKKCE